MAGKYDDVNPRLPRFQQEPRYQDKVQDAKADVLARIGNTPSSPELVRAFVERRNHVDSLKEQLSAANLELEAISQLITDQFDDEGVYSMKVQGATVRLQIEPYASVKDRDAFWRWCIANGLEESMTLPWQTTNSITKERLLDGKSEPDGVEAFQKTKLVLTRDKAGR